MSGVTIDCLGETLSLQTDARLFSPRALDAGTAAMLRLVPFQAGWKVLDLGCGYGAVGVLAAKKCGPADIWMLDNSAAAVAVARRNAALVGIPGPQVVLSDGFRSLDATGFDAILSNPPYHTDFAVAKHFIEKGFNRLKIGGTFYMVTKRRDWYRNKLSAIFGGVRVTEADGYFVFAAQRRDAHYAGGNKHG